MKIHKITTVMADEDPYCTILTKLSSAVIPLMKVEVIGEKLFQ
jgi:hypothetical protein